MSVRVIGLTGELASATKLTHVVGTTAAIDPDTIGAGTTIGVGGVQVVFDASLDANAVGTALYTIRNSLATHHWPPAA